MSKAKPSFLPSLWQRAKWMLVTVKRLVFRSYTAQKKLSESRNSRWWGIKIHEEGKMSVGDRRSSSSFNGPQCHVQDFLARSAAKKTSFLSRLGWNLFTYFSLPLTSLGTRLCDFPAHIFTLPASSLITRRSFLRKNTLKLPALCSVVLCLFISVCFHWILDDTHASWEGWRDAANLWNWNWYTFKRELKSLGKP